MKKLNNGKILVSAMEAYKYAYNTSFPNFPTNWYVTENFKWNEVFINERREDGIPLFETFANAAETAQQMQHIRDAVERPINIHCWVRQIPHNKRIGSKATLSAHLNGRAVDFDISHMTAEEARRFIANMRLPIRIEQGTPTWCHIDIGNSYTNNYYWGFFNP